MLMRTGLSALAATLIVAAFALSPAQAQILRKGAQDRPGTPAAPGAAAPVSPSPGETAGQTRREGRQEAREARQEARAVGETGPEARQTARESRQGTRQNIQATRAADFGLWFNTGSADGLVINDLTDNGMFATAGFREGDRIVSINGQPITTEAQFVQYLSGPNIGTQPVQIVVIRGGQQQTLVLQPNVLTQGVVAYDPLYQYGIVIDDRNPNQIAILRVYPRTPAYYAGLRAGDVITTVGGQRITGVDMFTQALTNADAALPLQITRAGQTRSVQLDSSLGSDANVRTALRPDFDAARGDATVRGEADTTRRPDSDRATPRTPDSTTTPPRLPDTGAPAAPRTAPATPAAPQAAPAAPGAPAQPRAGGQSAPAPAPAAPRTGAQPAPATAPAPAPGAPRTGGQSAPDAPQAGGQPAPAPAPAPKAPRAGDQPDPTPAPAPKNPR